VLEVGHPVPASKHELSSLDHADGAPRCAVIVIVCENPIHSPDDVGRQAVGYRLNGGIKGTGTGGLCRCTGSDEQYEE
jgi:hypothetical protein